MAGLIDEKWINEKKPYPQAKKSLSRGQAGKKSNLAIV